jgi:hypothetical protein
MAEASGVTEAGLKATLVEKLQATYVEIEDMSGTSPPILHISQFPTNHPQRRMRRRILRHNRLPHFPKKDNPRTAPPRQLRSQTGNCKHPCLDSEMLYA